MVFLVFLENFLQMSFSFPGFVGDDVHASDL